MLIAEDCPLAGALDHHRGLRRSGPWHYETPSAARLLSEQFETRDLSGFGIEDKPAVISAAGALLQYAQETQRGALPHLQGLQLEQAGTQLHLDALNAAPPGDPHPPGRQ